MFSNVQSKSVSQIIIEQIQDIIMSGKLKAGDVLPSERELAETMNVSRPALREALKALEVMGIVECNQGRGNFIVNKVSENFYKPMSLAFKLSNGDYSEILELRKMVEFYTVPKAARCASPLDVAHLYGLIHQMRQAETPSEKSHLDRLFHSEIASISNNSLISSTLNDASYLLDSFTDETIRISSFEGDSLEEIYNEHTKIVDAIKDHDEELSLEMIKLHLEGIRLDLMGK